MAHYTDPRVMRVNRADREEIQGDDRMSVLFDPFLDQQRAYQFEVNGYGVQADSIVNADGSRGFSRSSGARPRHEGVAVGVGAAAAVSATRGSSVFAATGRGTRSSTPAVESSLTGGPPR